MKILILIGSYRKRGNTDQIVGLVTEELQAIARQNATPLEIDTVYLGHQSIGFCRGCRVCFDRGEDKCPLKDDLLEIKDKMKTAEGLLLASPVYVDDVSGITKNWIDRMAHVCHRPEFAGKSAYMLLTVADSPFSHSFRTMQIALSSWGFHIAGQAGFKTGALMKPAEMRARHQQKVARAARQFYQHLSTHKSSRPSFFLLMLFKIQQLAWQSEPEGSFDQCYWSQQGWLNPQRDFYIAHRANPVKVALARLAGALIARFVS
jgi:multimeric flavodoxin WrbA